MKYFHEFKTPRNLYEKLIREYEKLDMVISGDNFFNFAATVVATIEFMKKADASAGMKRFLNRASKDDNVKICKGVVAGKTHFTIEIDEPNAHEGATFKHERLPEDYDKKALHEKSKSFKVLFDGKVINPFVFKEDILSLFDVYFKVKGQNH